MMRSAPDGKACVNNAGVMVRVSMGRWAFHPSIASWGRSLECLLRSLASLCDDSMCASGSMSANVYVATAWPALRTASSPVATLPQSSTMCRGLEGRVYLGMLASGGGEWTSLGEGRGVSMARCGGVVGETAAGQTGKGRVGMAEEEVWGGPLRACKFGKNVI